MAKRSEAKRPEVVETPEALAARVVKTLTAANSHTAPASAVKAFKEALAAAERSECVPWDRIKSPMSAARDFMLEKASETIGQAIPELWRVQANKLRGELGYAGAPALEKVLIDSAVLCWLRLAMMEIRYSAVAAGGNSFAAVEHTEKRLTLAQKRFTRACESLARVRKLSRPNLQINVAAEGGQQVNVA